MRTFHFHPATKLWLVISCLLFINQLSQGIVSPTADLDQAEQLVTSQTWQAGYSAQPPLYTYLVSLVFSVTGMGVMPLLMLKAALLSALLGVLLLIARQLQFSTTQQYITLAGMALIPQFLWESQRDLTHSVLATLCAALTLWLTFALRRNAHLGNYVALGVVVGAGLISKYNYAIFLVALLISVVWLKAYRTALLKPALAISVGVALLLIVPHVQWVMSHIDLATRSVDKFQTADTALLQGLGKAALGAVAFLTPLWFFAVRMPQHSDPVASDKRFFVYLATAIAGTVLVFVLFSGAQQVKDRWYQPLLFFVPLWLAMHIALRPRVQKALLISAGILFSVSIFALPLRTVFANAGNYSRPNLPLKTVFESIQQQLTISPDTIVAETGLLGGNARLVFTHAQVHVPHYALTHTSEASQFLIVCDAPTCLDNVAFQAVLTKLGIRTNAQGFTRTHAPLHYVSEQQKSVYWQWVTR